MTMAVKHSDTRTLSSLEAMIDAGRVGEALPGVLAALQAGKVEARLLEKAFAHALATDNVAWLSAVVAAIASLPARLRHWRLSMLVARVEGYRHDWSAKALALEAALSQGAEPAKVKLQLADAYERMLQAEKALAILDGETVPEPLLDFAEDIRSRCLLQLGDGDAAITLLKKWLPTAGTNWAAVAGQKRLARFLDKQGDWAQAWENVTRANAMAAELYGQSIENNQDRWRVEIWSQLFAPERDFSLPVYPCEDESPIFLVGFPRSGTTLLEQIMDAHPGLTALEEPATVSRALQQGFELARAKAWVRGSLRKPGLNKQQALLAVFSEMSRFSEKDVNSLRATYWQQVEALLGCRPARLVDKMPLNTIDMAFIRMLFPQARFIMALRHPCDVLISCLMQSFEANEGMANFHAPVTGATFYRQVMGLMERYMTIPGMASQVHKIRYEDLTEAPQREMASLMAFLELEMTSNQEAYYEHARDRGTLSTPSYLGVTQPMYRNAVNRWVHYREWLEPALKHLERAYDQFGYSLSDASDNKDEAG